MAMDRFMFHNWGTKFNCYRIQKCHLATMSAGARDEKGAFPLQQWEWSGASRGFEGEPLMREKQQKKFPGFSSSPAMLCQMFWTMYFPLYQQLRSCVRYASLNQVHSALSHHPTATELAGHSVFFFC
jgi:hypothetical protein